MRKEVEMYLVALLLLGIVFLFAFFQPGFTGTGYAVLSEYTNESACVTAGYTWENITEQNCTTEITYVNETYDCEPCLEYAVNETTNETGECISYTSCVNETSVETETCEEIVTGGQCLGDVCDSENLDLCLTSGTCENATGYWYDETCNADEEPSCSNDLTLCLDETNCTSVGNGYWYDEICNADEEPSCSNDVALCADETSCADAGWYWYDDECNEDQQAQDDETEETTEETVEETPEVVQTPVVQQQVTKMSVSSIPNQGLNPGESKTFSINANNEGNTALSSCRLKATADQQTWINVPEKTIALNPGESKSLSFTVSVPESAEAMSLDVQTSVICLQKSAASSFVLDVIPITFDFNLTDVRKIRSDEVRATYNLIDLSGKDQVVNLKFALYDNTSAKVSESTDAVNLSANESDRFRSIIPINETIEGNLTISVEANAQKYKEAVNEPIVLGGAPFLGFVAFGDVITGTGGIVLLIVVLVALIAITLTVRRIRKKSKNLRK